MTLLMGAVGLMVPCPYCPWEQSQPPLREPQGPHLGHFHLLCSVKT